jgi:hypothetical protein
MGQKRDRIQQRAAGKRQDAAAAARARASRKTSQRSAAASARARRSSRVDDARHGAYLKQGFMRSVVEGEPWAVAMHVEDGLRETEWFSNPFRHGPSKRELNAALAPHRRVAAHVRRHVGRLVKVRAYRRRFPGGGS